jgi:hypothetical protein
MLQLRRSCECCDTALPPESSEARICSFECTFCASCAQNVLQYTKAPIAPPRSGATQNSHNCASAHP